MIGKIILQGYLDYLVVSLKTMRKDIVVSVLLFGSGLVIGSVDLLGTNKNMFEFISQFFGRFNALYGLELYGAILFQNIKATGIVVFSGLFFAIFPIFSAVFNGLVIGCLVAGLKISGTMSPMQAVLHLLPHGVIEIPAMLCAISLGLRLGFWPFSSDKRSYIMTNLSRAAQFFCLVIVPLLVLAALVETIGIERLRG